ncbi:hypothetical protein [Luethyella okanaganae]|uniref:Uncharacterized protein n=1 Tax=Luethyella okanaganae TaxID=69372 RepID=A0ABW1VA87_9MICO
MGAQPQSDGGALRRLDATLPAWMVAHPLTLGWLWLLFFAALLVATELFDWPDWIWGLLIAFSALPSFAAMVIVLQATPRRSLHAHSSVFGHFFTRYLTLVAAFVAWTTSIVIGASISSALQLAAENREEEVLGSGLSLVFGSFPLVATLLWVVFLLRCAWFLTRVRGWRQHPARTTIPARLLSSAPGLRTVVIGLAHPGILLAISVLSGIALLAVDLGGLE